MERALRTGPSRSKGLGAAHLLSGEQLGVAGAHGCEEGWGRGVCRAHVVQSFRVLLGAWLWPPVPHARCVVRSGCGLWASVLTPAPPSLNFARPQFSPQYGGDRPGAC